jgi:hypothetical protein
VDRIRADLDAGPAQEANLPVDAFDFFAAHLKDVEEVADTVLVYGLHGRLDQLAVGRDSVSGQPAEVAKQALHLYVSVLKRIQLSVELPIRAVFL